MHNLMYVKEDIILPHTITFYDLIVDKAMGTSGPLFQFDLHEHAAVSFDPRVKSQDSHAGEWRCGGQWVGWEWVLWGGWVPACPHHLQVPYPPLVTDAAMTALALSAGAKVVGAGNAQQRAKPFMYAEDFAFMAEAVPAAFVMLGIRNESAGSVHGLHTPQFRLDESVLPLGAALHVQFALDFLAASSSNGGRGGGSGGGELGREEL